LVWYGKERSRVKFNPLFLPREGVNWVNYDFVKLPDGSYRKMTKEEKERPEKIPNGAKVYRRSPLTSPSRSETTSMPVEFEGKVYSPGKGGWKTNIAGFENLK